MRPLLLDLFCGAGGAATGYHRAGFRVVGVDIEPQPNYPFTFIQGDALEADFTLFDAVHASPPCQRFSTHTPMDRKDDHPDLIAPTRALLESTNLPYIIENVPGAPLEGYVIELCGSTFGMQLQRHRRFELGRFPAVLSPGCNHKAWERGSPYTITGHADGDSFDRRSGGKYLGFRDTAHAKELMGVPWMKRTAEIAEAIPPAYTEWIGTQLLAHLRTPLLAEDPK